MKKLYLFANWKMYLDHAESVKLAREFGKISYPKGSRVVVFPSAIATGELAPILKKNKIGCGAQNTYWADQGGYTGEVSARMYKNLGCLYALVGHAERRRLFHESNHDVRLKLEAILNSQMTLVLCIGETSDDRKKGKTEEVLEAQIRAALLGLTWPEGADLIIAYEPVWAVGTGESCAPAEAERVAGLIDNWVLKLIDEEPVVLYGGSVTAGNIRQYVDQPHIQGVLVGGASAKAGGWAELVAKLF